MPASGSARAAALIGVIQASCFIGGALLVLQIGPRHVFLVLGALTLLAVVAALMLPPLHTNRPTGAVSACPRRTGSRSGASCWASRVTACSC